MTAAKISTMLVLLAPSLFSQQGGRDELQKLFDQQTSAWNHGDLVGFMQAYEKSPELTFFGGDTIERGWEATLERYRRKYQGKGEQMGQLGFSDAQIDMLGPDAAMFTARWHLTFNNGQKREGLTTVICKRTKNGWKIVHDHSS